MRPHSVTLVTNGKERSKVRVSISSALLGNLFSGAHTGGLNIPCSWVVLGPNPDELIEVMRPQDGGVSC